MIDTYLEKPEVECQYSIKKELPSVVELMTIQSYTKQEQKMSEFILGKLSKIKGIVYNVDSSGNILVAKGKVKKNEFYPCLISHMDTVHKIVDNYKVHTKILDNKNILYATVKKGYITSLSGIGGDDKCGIWLCLKLLKELPKVKVIFTVEEECGAVGASKLDIKFFNDVGYLIEGDRKGNCDLITDLTGEICSKEFLEVIRPVADKHYYEENYGMLTDILAIKENKVNLSAINVSVGYYNPHSDKEYVVVEDLLNSVSFVKDCINALGYNKYEHSMQQPSYRYGGAGYDWYDDDYGYGYDYYKDKCSCSKSLVDLYCDAHNPVLTRHSGHICTCGEELEERRFSFNCSFCNKYYM